MNLVLAAAQPVAGPQYRNLLIQAGLARWLDAPPPPTMDPAATEAELAHLFGTVYTLLGEPGTRLMLRNWGTTLTPVITTIPVAQQIVAAVLALPPAERWPRALARLVELTAPFWAPATLREDATTWYLTLTDGPVCAEIRGASAPLCPNLVASYPRLLQVMTGRRPQVAEAACRAAGARPGSSAITKPPGHG
jgi:hypothetical protein